MEIKVQISDIDRRILERVTKITNEDPGVDDYNWVEVDTLLAILDSIEDKYNELKIEFDEYKEKVKDNYKPISEGSSYRYFANTIKRLDEECKKQYEFIKEKGLEEEYGEYNN